MSVNRKTALKNIFSLTTRETVSSAAYPGALLPDPPKLSMTHIYDIETDGSAGWNFVVIPTPPTDIASSGLSLASLGRRVIVRLAKKTDPADKLAVLFDGGSPTWSGRYVADTPWGILPLAKLAGLPNGPSQGPLDVAGIMTGEDNFCTYKFNGSTYLFDAGMQVYNASDQFANPRQSQTMIDGLASPPIGLGVSLANTLGLTISDTFDPVNQDNLAINGTTYDYGGVSLEQDIVLPDITAFNPRPNGSWWIDFVCTQNTSTQYGIVIGAHAGQFIYDKNGQGSSAGGYIREGGNVGAWLRLFGTAGAGHLGDGWMVKVLGGEWEYG